MGIAKFFLLFCHLQSTIECSNTSSVDERRKINLARTPPPIQAFSITSSRKKRQTLQFDDSNIGKSFLRSSLPSLKAAQIPERVRMYSFDPFQYSHYKSGLQLLGSDANGLDISYSFAMSNKLIGVTESIYCFSLPKVMYYKKTGNLQSPTQGFFGAGFSYNGLMNSFSNISENSLAAGLSAGLSFNKKAKTHHVLQVDLNQSLRHSGSQTLIYHYPKTVIECSYGIGF